MFVDAPVVERKGFVLFETKMRCRIIRRFAVSAEIAEQRVAERLSGRVRIAARVEIDRSGVSRTTVLISLVEIIQSAEFESCDCRAHTSACRSPRNRASKLSESRATPEKLAKVPVPEKIVFGIEFSY